VRLRTILPADLIDSSARETPALPEDSQSSADPQFASSQRARADEFGVRWQSEAATPLLRTRID
jgi:hypothetical protein